MLSKNPTLLFGISCFFKGSALWRHFQMFLQALIPVSSSSVQVERIHGSLYTQLTWMCSLAVKTDQLSWRIGCPDHCFTAGKALVCSSSFSISDANPHLGLWGWACSYWQMRDLALLPGRPYNMMLISLLLLCSWAHVYAYVYDVRGHVCHGMCVEIRGQLCGVISLLTLLYEFWN